MSPPSRGGPAHRFLHSSGVRPPLGRRRVEEQAMTKGKRERDELVMGEAQPRRAPSTCSGSNARSRRVESCAVDRLPAAIIGDGGVRQRLRECRRSRRSCRLARRASQPCTSTRAIARRAAMAESQLSGTIRLRISDFRNGRSEDGPAMTLAAVSAWDKPIERPSVRSCSPLA